ncbi:MAG: hypothetical protein M0Z35_16340, partial [Desulfitobacterium hafniense]|nr:hypothetical protein [Desulfitobacterium hafniense]
MEKTRYLQSLKEIRIIVNKGPGMGHQRAALTVMLRLRELGFDGIFDIWYDDVYFDDDENALEIGAIGRKLAILIPGFNPAPIARVIRGEAFSEETKKDQLSQIIIHSLSHPLFGNIRIARIPFCHHTFPSQVDLTFTGAMDV